MFTHNVSFMTTCKKCNSNNIIMVEYPPTYPQHYDGVSEFVCQDCRVRIGRWSEEELQDGEFEPRYGVRR
jgi:hypothetical protein